MIVDAHHHLWRLSRGDYGWLTPDLGPLWRDFEPADLAPLMAQAGVAGGIVVQAAETEAETVFLLDLADLTPSILGVVGWTDFAAPDAPVAIARLANHKTLKGLRPMLQDLEDDDYILDYRQRLNEAYEALVALEYGARNFRLNTVEVGLVQDLANIWSVRYLLSFNAGPNRDGHFGFNVQLLTLHY